MEIKTKNQIHPPQSKAKRVDNQGNHRYRLYHKDGNSTMLLCKGITKPAAKHLLDTMHKFAKAIDVKIEGNFILAQ